MGIKISVLLGVLLAISAYFNLEFNAKAAKAEADAAHAAHIYGQNESVYLQALDRWDEDYAELQDEHQRTLDAMSNVERKNAALQRRLAAQEIEVVEAKISDPSCAEFAHARVCVRYWNLVRDPSPVAPENSPGTGSEDEVPAGGAGPTNDTHRISIRADRRGPTASPLTAA